METQAIDESRPNVSTAAAAAWHEATRETLKLGARIQALEATVSALKTALRKATAADAERIARDAASRAVEEIVRRLGA